MQSCRTDIFALKTDIRSDGPRLRSCRVYRSCARASVSACARACLIISFSVATEETSREELQPDDVVWWVSGTASLSQLVFSRRTPDFGVGMGGVEEEEKNGDNPIWII